MSIYPESIARKARSPKFIGRSPDENGAGVAASFVCGSSIRFSLCVEPESKQIEQIRYETNGCGFVLAAAEDLTERNEGRKLTELSAIEGNSVAPVDLDSNERQHCLDIVSDSFRAALADHRRRTIEEFKGETALICTCFGVSEDKILDAINNRQLRTVSSVSALCNAGSGCGSCQMLIQELIDSAAGGR